MAKTPKKANSRPLSIANRPIPKAPLQPPLMLEHSYQGPVPPPEILEKMNKILPGAAERIFVMAEKEQSEVFADRQRLQQRADEMEKNAHIESMTALWMAFAVCILFAGAGIFMIFNGFENIGGVLVGTTMIGVVGSFLKTRKKN